MELKREIDADIQDALTKAGITFVLDRRNRIEIYEARLDLRAKAGMLYLIPSHKLPNGELPFLAGPAEFVYGVFHLDGKAAIIEVSTLAMEGPLVDYYEQHGLRSKHQS